MTEGHLILEYNNDHNTTIDHFEIENGHLYAFYLRGENMAKVDLGKVVGERGIQGEQGIPGKNGKDGVPGKNGKDGISPTFSIESDGHLYADYDNPYKPNE